MFENYLSRKEFQEFKNGLLDRTRIYFNSIINNVEFDLDLSDTEYFYIYLLPTLIDLDYFHFVSTRYCFNNQIESKSIKIQIIQFLKIILNKINKTKNKIMRKNLSYANHVFGRFLIEQNIDETKILSLNYFHRHNEYFKEFKKYYDVIEIDNQKLKSLSDNFNKLDLELFKSPFRITNFYERELINQINFFLNFRKSIKFSSKLLMFSAHSWVNSNISKLIISYVSTNTKIPIISCQPGLLHQHATCVGQVIWERYVSDYYATWSEPINQKDFFVGSMYINKSLKKNENIKETLILPQVPSSSLPGCFSNYWTLTKNDFISQIDAYIDAIDNILCNSKSPLFRIKNCDYKLYSQYIFKNFKQIPIDAGNVNKSENFNSTEKSYVFCITTAMVQAVYSGSQTFGMFSNKDSFLEEKFQSLIPERFPFECDNLTRKLSINLNKYEYVDNLIDLVRKII